ncbi:LytTR family DNA-binding domain-containing protein [Sulfitobacter sp.]|uniref:LytTR family DNA-binding domain-containing protein n=1 Tax=Sulfitobacter sp. TaxID=1903071 RepID=UPI003EF9D1C0
MCIWMTSAAVAGPFGTLEALGVGGRSLYWGAIAGGSILLSFGAEYFARGMEGVRRLVAGVGFVVVVSSSTHAINALVFDDWGGIADWAYLTAIVGIVTAAVHLLIWAVIPEKAVAKPERDIFLRRLPIEFRALLVRIEAQDHYLNVITARGQALIFMRLGDAIAELEGQGVQVHRSHWVATDAVAKHRRDGGRDLLVMADGSDVPVSRSFRGAAQDAGLL